MVQGVGFRPFVYRLAVKKGLTGFVQNRPEGVTAEVEGPPSVVDAFLDLVRQEMPPLAHITTVESTNLEIINDKTFKIISSNAQGHADVHITPDAATCPDCLSELFDPDNRRYRYPFINCTNCGPRLTIINALPYDRANTSMSCFDLCPQCLAEYENPSDRRFHAEPNACAVCGPRLTLLDGDGNAVESSDPVRTAVDLLLSGHIFAIKGLGGFHLAIDAGSDEAVQKLRLRKYREEKPLAIMVRDIDAVRQIARVTPDEEDLLASAQRPIVLLQKNENNLITGLIAPGVPNLGIMLPYTPLQHLLLEKHFSALVMTSANQVDEPICIGNREALSRLKGIADYFLVHNRDILVRCDDSIAFSASGKLRMMRRSRGFVPQPIPLNKIFPSVLALGGELKTTHCILKDNFAFMSPHIGDMETPQARDFFSESLTLMKRITQSDPQIIACDLHPAYYSSQAARELTSEKVIQVQHHHAHIVSCMAENQLEGDVLGLAMDGTGYGPDGTAWGGEFLIASETGFTRFGHLPYLVLPGGEKAVREPWRIGVSLLKTAYGPAWQEIARNLNLCTDQAQMDLLNKIIDGKIHSPLSCGLGRLFDGVAALIGLRRTVSFEGQAAMELEALATGTSAPPYPFILLQKDNEPYRVDTASTIRAVVADLQACRSKAHIAASFHSTLIEIFAAMGSEMRKATGLTRVALSGGCFQNKILLEGSIEKIGSDGFEVYSHSRVPSNDGGISLGQAVIAAAMIENAY
ncbi:MAG: carbamoyltransferase HypF [Deltaproteobacteria bacterium HGW-Deltaproteobacteria-12]|jgi:hydrogenase maturation protein HypF|nr:MAG: carbamoyltransferase HypF [Deltaproteobacteria bacterium HGW-Deltaproteobacteria-12]